MSRPFDEVHRDKLEGIFEEVLQDNMCFLQALSINCYEDSCERITKTSFSFEEIMGGKKEVVGFENICGQGFIDCIFSACMDRYSEEHKSLKRIKLKDLLVRPVFMPSLHDAQTGVKTDVVLKLEVPGREMVEFKNRSRSVIFSSYTNTLAAFQFYINCELSFKKLKFLVSEARARNRSDLVSGYLYKISYVAEMNDFV